MPSPFTAVAPDELITYDKAAEMLGIKRVSALQLAKRGHLHPIEDPEDRRRRLLSRREVEAYATKRFLPPTRTRSPRQGSSPPIMPPSLTAAGTNETPTIEPQTVMALGAAFAVAGLFLLAFKGAGSVSERVLILGILVALALFIVGVLYEQGNITDERRRRLEQLARAAQADPEPFVSELERALPEFAEIA